MIKKIKSVVYSVISAFLLLTPAFVGAQLKDPTGTGLPTSSVTDIVTGIMNWLLGIVGVVGVIGFAIAGILYLTAAGDEERINKAKSAMLYSIIGVIVALAGLVALQFAKSMLGGGSNL
jgi:uncharacterized membrane protein